jgi:hypothetical protein
MTEVNSALRNGVCKEPHGQDDGMQGFLQVIPYAGTSHASIHRNLHKQGLECRKCQY